MKRLRLPGTGQLAGWGFRPELRILEYVSTQRGDAERGPMIRMSPTDARIRLLSDGELAWVRGPRRNEVAVVVVDEDMPDGSIAVRDIAGVAISERVVVTRPDLDTKPPGKMVG